MPTHRRVLIPPALILMAFFTIGCTIPLTCLTTDIANQFGQTVKIEFSSRVRGRNHEQLTVDLAPGGTLSRRLVGNPDEVHVAAAAVTGGARIDLAFELDPALLRGTTRQTFTLRRDAEGVRPQFERAEEPRR